jgi:hypothetical protein
MVGLIVKRTEDCRLWLDLFRNFLVFFFQFQDPCIGLLTKKKNLILI